MKALRARIETLKSKDQRLIIKSTERPGQDKHSSPAVTAMERLFEGLSEEDRVDTPAPAP